MIELNGKEIWKPIPNADGYEVSNLGRVRSLSRVIVRCDGVKKTITGRILRPNIGTNGYLYVQCGMYGKTKYIHRCVAMAFVEKHRDDTEVDHINRNKLDNRAENLRWITHFENSSIANKGKKKNNSLEHNPKTKKVVGYVGNDVVCTYNCAKYLTMIYGVNYSTLRSHLQKGGIIINNILFKYETDFRKKI